MSSSRDFLYACYTFFTARRPLLSLFLSTQFLRILTFWVKWLYLLRLSFRHNLGISLFSPSLPLLFLLPLCDARLRFSPSLFGDFLLDVVPLRRISIFLPPPKTLPFLFCSAYFFLPPSFPDHYRTHHFLSFYDDIYPSLLFPPFLTAIPSPRGFFLSFAFPPPLDKVVSFFLGWREQLWIVLIINFEFSPLSPSVLDDETFPAGCSLTLCFLPFSGHLTSGHRVTRRTYPNCPLASEDGPALIRLPNPSPIQPLQKPTARSFISPSLSFPGPLFFSSWASSWSVIERHLSLPLRFFCSTFPFPFFCFFFCFLRRCVGLDFAPLSLGFSLIGLRHLSSRVFFLHRSPGEQTPACFFPPPRFLAGLIYFCFTRTSWERSVAFSLSPGAFPLLNPTYFRTLSFSFLPF